MPVEKRDFLGLLKESDGILDSAEDVIVLLDMRKTKVSKEIKKDFIVVMKKAIATVDTLERAMDLIEVIHLLKVIDRMGCIADHAENAADMIRVMIAKS